MSLLFALLLSGTTVELDPAWQPVAEPKKLLSSGKIQCLEPDVARRTCLSMSWLSNLPSGETRFRTVYALSNQHGLAVQTKGTMQWEGEKTCLVLDAAALEPSFLVKLAAPHNRITDPRYFLYFKEQGIQALVNRTICGRIYHHRDTGAYLNIGTVDGEFAGEMMYNFSFIDAQSGYRLRAAND
jgi:hypothetical protein